jgi:hypothetical protein
MKRAMMLRRATVLVATLMISAWIVPTSATATEDVDGRVQIVGLEIVYVPPAVEVPEPPVGPNNIVYGNCGWASMWVNTSGTHRARFEADAGSSIGVMVRVDWTISWTNADTGASGGWSETTWQFSPTWGVKRETLTGPGTVYGTLTRLFATHWNGIVCQGLVPWDWEEVP